MNIKKILLICCAFLLIIPILSSGSYITDDIIAYYDSDIYNDYPDSTGVYNASPKNGAYLINDGVLNGSYIFLDNFPFDRIDTPVYLSNFSSYNFSFSLWVKFNYTDHANGIFSNRLTVNQGVRFFIVDSGDYDEALGIFIPTVNGNLIKYTYNNTIIPFQWYHFVVSYNGTDILLYQNNTKLNLNTISSGHGDIIDNNQKFRLGGDYYSSSNPIYWFKGQIDEVGIWDRVLEETEIGYLYNSYKGYNPFYNFDSLTINFTAKNNTIIFDTLENEFGVISSDKNFLVSSEFYINNTLIYTNNSHMNNTEWSFNYIFPDFNSYDIYFMSYNPVSNITSTVKGFTFINNKPAITIFNKQNKTINIASFNKTFLINADIIDNSSLKNISFYIDNILIKNINYTDTKTANFKYYFNSSNNINYTFRFTACDYYDFCSNSSEFWLYFNSVSDIYIETHDYTLQTQLFLFILLWFIILLFSLKYNFYGLFLANCVIGFIAGIRFFTLTDSNFNILLILFAAANAVLISSAVKSKREQNN